VVEAITDVLTNHWGNASADNSFGKDAMAIIDAVTNQVANDINCNPEEIIWTSGACEANSLAIYGLVQNKFLHVLTSKLEHASINLALNQLDKYECSYDFIKNDCNGFIDLIDLEEKLSHQIDNWHMPLVSISFANSEIGVIQDVKSIAEVVHKYNGILHVDATQMYPWYEINVKGLGIDLMSVSGQKMNCCKGIGFLFVKAGIQIGPIIYGSQQDERRGGTYPTHLIAAFGKALEISRKQCKGGIRDIRDYLLNKLLLIDNVTLNGPAINSMRLLNNISLTIDDVNANTLVTMCDLMGIIIAKGSACKSYELKPSETLLAIGLTKEQALNTIRISLDEFNSLAEIDQAADIITALVERIRNEE
jgi:cysteine desulfurase